MKKIITTVLLAIMLIGVAVSQEVLSPAQQRKAERAKQQEIEKQQLELAMANKTFYFRGQSMQIRNLDRYYLRAPYNYVDLQPGYLRVQLPYFTSQYTMNNTPMILDFESDKFTCSVDERRGIYTVTIEVLEVKNTYTTTRKSQSGAYRLVFSIGKGGAGSNSMLSLTPNFTGTITYTGDLELDN